MAQRILSARNERDGLLSVLWFNFAHYALRSWPWILAALAVAVLYPNLAQPESGYVRLAVDHLPRAARGLLVAGFLAAFMSTIATHLNWGSSYLVSDFYRRFVRRDATERHYVGVSRWVTILLVVLGAWVSWELVTIRAGWEALLEIGAGTGKRLPASLVLVAHQCMERNRGDGHRAGGHTGRPLDDAISGI